MGKVSILLVEIQFQEFLCKGLVEGETTVAIGSSGWKAGSLVGGFSMRCSLCEMPQFSNGYCSVYKYEPN